ncbi:hypothetical protein R4769_20530 [Azotobacter beijerinckii]|nr:hypothetical protein [Azotobacter beijerinckii]MDV7213523.1 hypothetical protein [Azotobacter beijerinckii]
MIQVLARFQPTPSRFSAWRIDSWLSCRSVSPCSKATSAARLKVHRLVGLPKSRGLRCSKVRKRSTCVPASKGTDTFGAMRLLAQAGQSLGGKGPQGVAYGLRGAAEQGGDFRGGLAVGAGQQDLAAPQREGLTSAQTRLQGLPLLSTQGTNE